MSETQDKDDEHEPHAVTLLEKIATGISVLLVALLVTVLIWDAAHPDLPARLTVQVASPSLTESRYRVPLIVRNHGDQSVRDVVLHLELVAVPADTVIAESDLTIDWLPRESSRTAIGLFSRPSSALPVAARADVRGYVVP